MKRHAFLMAVVATVVAGSVCAEGGRVRRKAEAERHPPANAEARRAMIDPVPDGQLLLRPTFVSCSVCWGSAKPRKGLALVLVMASCSGTVKPTIFSA